MSENRLKEIENKLKIMSFWLLLNTERDKENPQILQDRIKLCWRSWKKQK